MKKYNLIVIVMLVVAVAAVVGIKNKKKPDVDGSADCANGVCTLPIPAGAPMQEHEKKAEPKAQPLPKLLDLGADKCVPCITMKPILDDFKLNYAAVFETEFIDVWKNTGAGEQYGIRMIPTQIFFDAEGLELFRHEGFFSKEDLLAKWKELGFDFTTGLENE